MSVQAILIDEYNCKLMANADVRALMSSVAQNPQTESVDMEKSKTTVREALKDYQVVRRQIIAWLNKVYFSISLLSVHWWWEMNTRLQKLFIVAIILEGDNLRSFGAIPELTDIPQCLIGIRLELAKQRAKFSILNEEYKRSLNNVDPVYKKLYLESK